MLLLFGQRSLSLHTSSARAGPRGPHAVVTCHVLTFKSLKETQRENRISQVHYV